MSWLPTTVEEDETGDSGKHGVAGVQGDLVKFISYVRNLAIIGSSLWCIKDR